MQNPHSKPNPKADRNEPSCQPGQEKSPFCQDPGADLVLPALPYAYDALDGWVDGQTMEIHLTRHHQAYLDNFKKFLRAHPHLATCSQEELLGHVGHHEAILRNSLGGHYNHSLFWRMVSPDGGGEPSAPLAAALTEAFGGVERFRTLFSEAAMGRFGSGWAWLIRTPAGKLAILSTPNQDSPLMDVVDPSEQGVPLLGLDVWEHAYYLRYQNRRQDYVSSFWKVVSWAEVERRLVAVATT